MLLDSDMSALIHFRSNLENHHKTYFFFSFFLWCWILYYDDMVD